MPTKLTDSERNIMRFMQKSKGRRFSCSTGENGNNSLALTLRRLVKYGYAKQAGGRCEFCLTDVGRQLDVGTDNG